jgi:hypothetical protein
MEDVTSGGTAAIPPPFARQKLLKSPKWVVPTVLGVILVSSVAIYLLSLRSSRVPSVPPAIVVLACPDLAPGVRRITSDFGTRFDVSDKVFTVHAGARDMPPGMLYVVKLKHADANIVVWRDDDVFRDLKTAFPVFSEHVEERNIRTSKERLVGTDRWGYLKSGERWRYVRFSSGDAAGYGPTPPKEASMLDQVVGSACLSRDAYFLK